MPVQLYKHLIQRWSRAMIIPTPPLLLTTQHISKDKKVPIAHKTLVLELCNIKYNTIHQLLVWLLTQSYIFFLKQDMIGTRLYRAGKSWTNMLLSCGPVVLKSNSIVISRTFVMKLVISVVQKNCLQLINYCSKTLLEQ